MASAALLDVLDEFEHRRHLVDAHAGGRLVEHEDLRLHGDQKRDFELALVAVRQGFRRDVWRLSASRTRSRIVLGLLDQIAPGVPHLNSDPARVGAALHGEAHVFERGELRKQVGELEGAPEPALRARGGARR